MKKKKQNIQLDIFESALARDEGIQQAMDHADLVEQSWSDTAYEFLLAFISDKTFMGEDLRAAAVGYISEPPDTRAWGGVIRRAAAAGIITRVGIGKKKTVCAHRAFATVWAFT